MQGIIYVYDARDFASDRYDSVFTNLWDIGCIFYWNKIIFVCPKVAS